VVIYVVMLLLPLMKRAHVSAVHVLWRRQNAARARNTPEERIWEGLQQKLDDILTSDGNLPYLVDVLECSDDEEGEPASHLNRYAMFLCHAGAALTPGLRSNGTLHIV
jgi:hypothetical protein